MVGTTLQSRSSKQTMKNNTIRLLEVRPGVLVEECLATPQGRSGQPIVTRFFADHYAGLVGRTIRSIQIENYEGRPLPVLMLDDGSSASVMCDPEGNGPGHLHRHAA